MPSSSEQLKSHVVRALTIELDDAVQCIEHCLRQLDESQVWQRPLESMNSIGNLLLHVCGNLRQWIVSGVGGLPDTRQRQAEFDERGPIEKAELLAKLHATVREAQQTMTDTDPERWGEPLTIQGFQVTGADALIHSVSHLRGHTQEIVHMTRSLLDQNYHFKFIPTTPERDSD